MLEEATTFIICEEESRACPGAGGYQSISHLCHLFLSQQNALWWMFAYIPLSDEKRNLWQCTCFQIVVIVSIRKLDARVILPLREEDQRIEYLERVCR